MTPELAPANTRRSLPMQLKCTQASPSISTPKSISVLQELKHTMLSASKDSRNESLRYLSMV